MALVFNLSGSGALPPDENLIPGNIKLGVSIYGVTGTLNPIVALTQSAYNALAVKDANTLYIIIGP